MTSSAMVAVPGPYTEWKDMIKQFVAEMKTTATSSDFKRKSPAERVQMVRQAKTKRRIITECETTLNEFIRTASAIQEASAEEQVNFLTRNQDLKFATTVLKRRQGHEIDVDVFQASVAEAAPREGEVVDSPYDNLSMLSLYSSNELWAQFLDGQCSQDLQTKLDWLGAVGMNGLSVRAGRNHVATVDFFQLPMEYVSSDVNDTCSAVACLEQGYEHRDLRQEAVPDVLVLVDPHCPKPATAFMRTNVYKTYLSYLFTGNLDNEHSGHHLALLGTALVRSVEQLGDPETRTAKHLATIFNLVYTIKQTRPGYFRSDSKWNSYLCELLRVDNPGVLLTEADNGITVVTSMVQVLLMLCCCEQAGPLFRDPNPARLNQLALAIAAEAVSRDCRIFAADKELPLQALLGVTDDSCPVPHLGDDWKLSDMSHDVDWETATLPSSSPSILGRSNCSIRSVYHFLVWLKYWHTQVWTPGSDSSAAQSDGVDDLAVWTTMQGQLESTRPQDVLQVSAWYIGAQQVFARHPDSHTNAMPLFFREFAPGVYADDEWQLAIVAQGCRYHRSAERKHGLTSLTEPRSIIRALAREVRMGVYFQRRILFDARLLLEREECQRQERKALLQMERDEFDLTHGGMPHFFTLAEVEQLNTTRSVDAQLEMDPLTHLLRYSCSYPKCNRFMQPFVGFDDDGKRTRCALFTHLRPLTSDQFYLPGFHRTAMAYLESHPHSAQLPFVETMVSV
jgi:hypothetical protein